VITVTSRRSTLPSQTVLKEKGKSALRTKGDAWAPEALELLRNVAADLAKEIYEEAIKAAKREGLQQVSMVHVQEARRKLLARRNTRWFRKFAGTIGGVLLGSVAAQLLCVLLGQPVSGALAVLLCVLAALGTGLALYHALQ